MRDLMRFLRAWGWIVVLTNGVIYPQCAFFHSIYNVVTRQWAMTDVVSLVIWSVEAVLVWLALPDLIKFCVSVRDLLIGEKDE